MSHFRSFVIYLIIFSSCYYSQGQDFNKYAKKGLKFHQNKEFEKAIEQYKKALKSDPQNYICLLNLSGAFIAIKNYDEGEKFLNEAKKISTLHPDYHFLMAEIYSNSKQHLKSSDSYKKALFFGYKEDQYIYYNIGCGYYYGGVLDSARKYFLNSYKIDSLFAPVYNNLGWTYIDSEPANSCKYFQKAFEVDSLNPVNINNLGYSNLICGNLEIAYQLLKKAERLDSSNSFIARNFGLYFKLKDEKKKACAYYRKSIKLGIIKQWGEYYIRELRDYCIQ